MAATESVCARQRDHLTIVEAHSAEDDANVILVFGAVRQSAIRCAEADIAILTARSPWNDGALHFLDGADTSKGPEVRIGDPREFFWRYISICISGLH